MKSEAKLKYLRASSKKTRLVIDMVRGKKVQDALNILAFSKKTAARSVKKLIESALANAKHNHGLTDESIKNVRIRKITADHGPVLKRYTQKAFGSGASIRKPTSHLHVLLSDEPVKGNK